MYKHTEENKPIPHTYPYRFCPNLRKPKMSPFNSPYLTQNYRLKYVVRSSGKTRLLNQWRHLMFVKWKYTAREKIGVKVVYKYNKCEVTRRHECWCNLNHRTTDHTQKYAKFEHQKIVWFQSFCDSLFFTSHHLRSYP